jgi:hypothetical protein
VLAVVVVSWFVAVPVQGVFVVASGVGGGPVGSLVRMDVLLLLLLLLRFVLLGRLIQSRAAEAEDAQTRSVGSCVVAVVVDAHPRLAEST